MQLDCRVILDLERVQRVRPENKRNAFSVQPKWKTRRRIPRPSSESGNLTGVTGAGNLAGW